MGKHGQTKTLEVGKSITIAPSSLGDGIQLTLHDGGTAHGTVHLTHAEANDLASDIHELVARTFQPPDYEDRKGLLPGSVKDSTEGHPPPSVHADAPPVKP